MQALRYSRRMQVTLASILTGAGFKYYDALLGGGSVRPPTVCKICGEQDTPEHIMRHADVPNPPHSPDDMVNFLVQIADTAVVVNPHISAPLVEDPAAELELPHDETASESSIDSLSFEEAL